MTSATTPNINKTVRTRHNIKIDVVKQANTIRTTKAQVKLKTSPNIAVKMHNITGMNRLPTAIVPQIPIMQLKIRQRKVNIEQT